MVLAVNAITGSPGTVRNLSIMQRSTRKTLAKLSSGRRINCAADDPAGLVVSERLRAQIGSLAEQIRNLDNAINRNDTADSCLAQLEEELLEMREIAVAATSTGYIDEAMVEAYEDELNAAGSTFNGIVNSAEYGTQKLLDGSDGSVVSLRPLEQLDLSTSQSAARAIDVVDEKLDEVHRARSELGANSAHELASMRTSLEVSHVNLIESESAIRDIDMAMERTNLTSRLLRIQIGTAMLAQGNLTAANVNGLLRSP